MDGMDPLARGALEQQLAAIKELQRDVEEKLRLQAEHEDAAAAAPWLVRRGKASNVGAPRTLPPWLARRGA